MSVRQRTCGGCWRNCKRADFRGSSMTYEDTRAALKKEVKAGGRAKAVTRRTILGRMYEMKEKEWKEETERCPMQGEKYPTTIDDFLQWASKLKTKFVRAAIGVDPRRRRGLQVRELAEFWKVLSGEERVPF